MSIGIAAGPSLADLARGITMPRYDGHAGRLVVCSVEQAGADW